MDRMTMERTAEFFALDQFLTDYESNYDEIIEAFMADKIPDDVIIYELYENETLDQLAWLIEGLRDSFIIFGERVKNV